MEVPVAIPDRSQRLALASKMEQYYRRNSGYHASATDMFGERPLPEEQAVFDWLARQLGSVERPRVLELGCGRGESARYLLDQTGTASYVGVDPSPTALAHAPGQDARRSVLVGDGCRLPFSDGTFDLCFFNYVLEHTVFPDLLLREAVRVVQPGGLVSMIVPVADLPWLFPPSARGLMSRRRAVVVTTLSRWAEALGIRYLGRLKYRLVADPIALHATEPGLAASDEDQVYWGWTMEIIVQLKALGCGLVFRQGRDIRPFVVNGRRPLVDAARRFVFALFRLSMGDLDPSHYTTTVSLVFRKP